MLNNVASNIDSCFQFSYVAVISWRLHVLVFRRWTVLLPLASFGFTPTIINIVAPNPSTFPDCRRYSSPASEYVSFYKLVDSILSCLRIVLLVPCLRATFDAIATISLLTRFNSLRRSAGIDLGFGHESVQLWSELCREESQELITIFVIMTMEAVFVQMPSVRTHARNYIAPFVDSLTALLATRFIMGILTRGNHADDDIHSFVSECPEFRVPSPTVQTPESSVASLLFKAASSHSQPGISNASSTMLSSEGSPLPPGPDLSVLFPTWPPEVWIALMGSPLTWQIQMGETENSSVPVDPQSLGNWPSRTGKNNSFSSLAALESGGLNWPPETFGFEFGYDNDVDPQAVIETPQVIF
ncbi:hypothetical protein MSAN_00253400 [Mycena sanguinolenta]|uniref:Uncharacterized protein n=1 Tax=Mycena sanguinolenta TaxID=230812 RepID=A0A8H7DL96_9AGAR|nr:hypothetical protein MSAN_00253400 [Mycena sanguinolenta]